MDEGLEGSSRKTEQETTARIKCTPPHIHTQCKTKRVSEREKGQRQRQRENAVK